MKMYSLSRTVGLPVIKLCAVPLLLLGLATTTQEQPINEAGVQVLTRGPVHEAFAEASMMGAKAGVIVTKAPYDDISELPPDQRPEGANMAWIPGYWSWDDDRSDFIWVSGVWRDLPPGRQWVPGYWTSVQGGSQWISGFWGDAAQNEVTYLPPPPEPLEVGPSSPAPRPDNLWTPGCWVWQHTRYDWQPGYWVAQQPDWVWSPAHYTWTPRGYIYVPGYWDHDIVHRGVMFAPVYYERPVYQRSGYYYSPSTVIDLAVMLTTLFVQSSSRHYYYGDYYDRGYEDRGFYPWHSRQARRYGDDPIYSHYRSRQFKQDSDWDRHIDEQYRYRRDHIDARPPQTLALQVNINNNQRTGGRENFFMGRSLTEAAQSTAMPHRFTSVNMDERRQIESRGHEVQKLQFERARMEKPLKADGKPSSGRDAEPFRMRLPASPVAARSTENVTGAKTPPPIPVAPRPQAAEDRGRHETPQRVEVRTGTTRSQKAQERAKPAVKTHTERTEDRPSLKGKQPQQIRHETITPESQPARSMPSGQTTIPARIESKPRAPRSGETTRAHEARPEAKPRRSSKVQRRPQAAEPRRESPKPEIKKQEVRSQQPETKAQAQREDTRKQKGNREQTPRTNDRKDKKRGK